MQFAGLLVSRFRHAHGFAVAVVVGVDRVEDGAAPAKPGAMSGQPVLLRLLAHRIVNVLDYMAVGVGRLDDVAVEIVDA